MVPSSFGCGVSVLAAMAMLAPSRAARSAIASPMPRDAPVMNSVLPLSDIGWPRIPGLGVWQRQFARGRPLVLTDSDQVSIRIADVEVAAAVGLVLGLAVESNTAGRELGGHRIHVIDVNVEGPVLVERCGVGRPAEVEKDRHVVPADDAEGWRLAEKQPGPESQFLAIERFARLDVLDFEGRRALHELCHALLRSAVSACGPGTP